MNTIAQQIADFLKDYIPFDNLTFQELTEIAINIRVINLEKHQTIFNINDPIQDSFYVVAAGIIDLSVISDAEEELINKCKEGDIFGLRPFFAKNNYMMTAKAHKESIVYAIPIAVFRPFVANNSNVLNFLLESFALNTWNPNDKENLRGKLTSNQKSEMHYFQSINYNRTPLIGTPNDIAKDIAMRMTDNSSTSVIICENNLPIGIVTHSDLCSKIVTGEFPATITADVIMSSPVMTVIENISLGEAQLLMLKNNVSHLCVTQDGTDNSVVKGIISEHDLIIAQTNNPGILIKEIKKAQNPKELKQIRERLSELIQNSIQKNIPLFHINNIASEINSVILKRAVELAILTIGTPPARFAWVSIGSQGRKEQLLLTDQDSMLIFEDVLPDQYKDVKDYFLKLANEVISTLQITGYEPCPYGHIASNILWCKSLTDWIKQYDSWMNTPGESDSDLSTIFFDLNLVFGEEKIVDVIENTIYKNVKNNSLFFDFLGNDTLKKNSPLSFFKKIVVEEDEPNKDKFDIKSRALMPLIDGARFFALHFNIKEITNTYLRFKQLAIIDSNNSDIYLNCAEAFLILSRFRINEGLRNDNSGEFLNLEELSKMEKEKLKNAFAPMRDLEELIKNKFKLTQFS